MLFLPIVLVLAAASAGAAKLEVLYQWKVLDYIAESSEAREITIRDGIYNPKNIISVDMDRAQDGRVFLTTVGEDGVPATLSIVTDKRTACGSPLLAPYPNWDWHRLETREKCKGMTAVHRIAIDKCNRLWALDSGTVGREGRRKRVCPAQLLVFNLSTNKLIKRVEIPNNVADPSNEENGLLSNLIVETEGPKCAKTWVGSSNKE